MDNSITAIVTPSFQVRKQTLISGRKDIETALTFDHQNYRSPDSAKKGLQNVAKSEPQKHAT